MSAEEHARQPSPAVLHVYGQEAWHDDVRIGGNRAGLEALAAVIEACLRTGKPARSDHFFVADGEGYSVIVEVNDADWQSPAWQGLAVPYSRDYAR